MRCRMLIGAIVLAILSANVYAQGDLGVGLSLGNPTGLSVKYWLDDTEAIGGGLGWALSGHDDFQVHADYLVHRFDIVGTEEEAGRAPLYYGIGARIKDERHDTAFGIRIPLGISYMFAEQPFDLFAEIVPVVDLAPDVDLDLDIAIGFRFYLP